MASTGHFPGGLVGPRAPLSGDIRCLWRSPLFADSRLLGGRRRSDLADHQPDRLLTAWASRGAAWRPRPGTHAPASPPAACRPFAGLATQRATTRLRACGGGFGGLEPV